MFAYISVPPVALWPGLSRVLPAAQIKIWAAVPLQTQMVPDIFVCIYMYIYNRTSSGSMAGLVLGTASCSRNFGQRFPCKSRRLTDIFVYIYMYISVPPVALWPDLSWVLPAAQNENLGSGSPANPGGTRYICIKVLQQLLYPVALWPGMLQPRGEVCLKK